jgi:iron complex transport system permease protein
MLGALRSFLMLALSDETVSLQVVMSWVLGGIQTPSWNGLLVLAGITLGCVVATRLWPMAWTCWGWATRWPRALA